MRCFCPPDKPSPRSPSIVSYPSGNSMIKSCAFARLAESMISSIEASGRPYEMLALIEEANKNDSCKTKPIFDRNDDKE